MESSCSSHGDFRHAKEGLIASTATNSSLAQLGALDEEHHLLKSSGGANEARCDDSEMDRRSSAIAGLALIPVGIAILAEETDAAGWVIFAAGWLLALAPVVIAFRQPRPPTPRMG